MSIFQNNLFKTVVDKKNDKYFIIIILSLMVSGVLGVYAPIYINDLYQSYSQGEKFLQVFKLLIGLFIAEYFVRIIYQYVLNKYIQKVLTDIRALCFEKWLLSYESISTNQSKKDRFPLGEVLARMMSDTEAIIELITSGAFTILIDVIFIVSSLASFLTLNTRSGVLIIIAEVLACGLLVYVTKYMREIFIMARKSTSQLSRRLADVTAGLESTYYTPHENYASKKSLKDFEEFLKIQLKANIWDAGYFSVAESLYPLLLAFLVIIFPYSQIVEMAVLAAIIDLIQRSIGPIKSVAGKITNIQRAKTGIDRINEFIVTLSKFPLAKIEESIIPTEFQSLRVKIKEFSYDQNSDFKISNIDFEGKRGELIGLVGMSGSGKSTILKILSCQITSPESELIIDTGIKKIVLSAKNIDDIFEYRRYISIVSQDSHVFTGSLLFNITLQEEASSHFEAFLNDVKNKIDYIKKWNISSSSLINPKDLSVGQKQLLSALRACYLNKPIVLFDEISSSLDGELELALRKLVLLIQKNALTIIVAHRIETIIEADNIVVMDQGKIIDQGQHQQLINESSIYQQFINELKSLS